MSVRRDRSCRLGIARVLVLLVAKCLRVIGLSLEPKLRCMRSIVHWKQGPQGGSLFPVKGLSQGPRSGALLYVHDCS